MHPLKLYLSNHAINVEIFAKSIDCSSTQIYRIIQGTRYPSRELAVRIENGTEGEVTAAMLLTYNIGRNGETGSA
jgi:plasmid maintenance system antidote protein VapI